MGKIEIFIKVISLYIVHVKTLCRCVRERERERGGVKNAFMHKLFGFVFSWVCLCISVFVCFVCTFVCFWGLGEGGFKRWLLHCRNRVLLVTDTIRKSKWKLIFPFFEFLQEIWISNPELTTVITECMVSIRSAAWDHFGRLLSLSILGVISFFTACPSWRGISAFTLNICTLLKSIFGRFYRKLSKVNNAWYLINIDH